MPSIPPIYLTDSPSGQQWNLGIGNDTRILATPVSGIPSSQAPPSVGINNPQLTQSFLISIMGNPPSVGYNWGDIVVTPTTFNASYPTQIPTSAPNGTVYAFTIDPNSSRLSVTLANLADINCNQPISSLAVRVQERLEELPTGAPGTFWSYSYEILTGLEEAICDLLLLIGRPTQTVQVPMNLSLNTVWQQIPRGIFLISDIWGAKNKLKKVTLAGLDYTQSSWDSSWESDSDVKGAVRWAPVGMNMFVVHPAPAASQQVLLDGIAYPFSTSVYPPSGAEVVPFHEEIFVALEEYAAHILRLKEASSEFQGSIALYKSYLDIAKRLNQIEDRRDSMLFSTSFGASAGLQSRTNR